MNRFAMLAAVMVLGSSVAYGRAGSQPLDVDVRQRAAVAVPAARITFRDAIDQALRANPTVHQAASEILRANALLGQTRSTILPGVNASVVTTTLNEGRTFGGTVTTPQNQAAAALSIGMPVLAPALWAQQAQARDEVRVAEVNATDVRKQVAVATAQAYLAIFTRRRVFEANVRARDTARAHYDLAHQQRLAGSGSLLNELRAQQTLDADEVLVEESSLAVYAAQEALGVLVAASAPVDAADEPVLEVPESLPESDEALLDARTDVRLAQAREAAALRVWRDSWKDWFPTAQALFQPQYVAPQTIFQPSASWRAQLTFALPIFDAGYRHAQKTERQAMYNETDLQRAAVVRQARSDVRTASEGVSSADRALGNARKAADEARHVLDIVNVSFKVGAATEIEVIDAQRSLLDAETSVAIAQDVSWQARLALLVAIGKFP